LPEAAVFEVSDELIVCGADAKNMVVRTISVSLVKK
jgi:hypothetical protein